MCIMCCAYVQRHPIINPDVSHLQEIISWDILNTEHYYTTSFKKVRPKDIDVTPARWEKMDSLQ